LLERIVNFGVKKGLCPGLGFKIEFPKVNNLRTEDLTPEQLSNLMAALDEEQDIQAANLMRMALLTGMRRGELFKLEWQDVDFDRGFIHIRIISENQSGGGRLLILIPKISEITKRTIKMMNSSLAISTERTAMPVNPSSAANKAMIKKVIANPSMTPSGRQIRRISFAQSTIPGVSLDKIFQPSAS
jgi:integrase